MIVVAKTDPPPARRASASSSSGRHAGLPQGQAPEKVGLKSQDTSELFFDDVRVPTDNLLGKEGEGFIYLMQKLPWSASRSPSPRMPRRSPDRQHGAIRPGPQRRSASRSASSRTRATSSPNARPRSRSARVFVDKCREIQIAGTLDSATASRWRSSGYRKYGPRARHMRYQFYAWRLRLHVGISVAQAYADARVQLIYGGTSEIMKELISRQMGLSAGKQKTGIKTPSHLVSSRTAEGCPGTRIWRKPWIPVIRFTSAVMILTEAPILDCFAPPAMTRWYPDVSTLDEITVFLHPSARRRPHVGHRHAHIARGDRRERAFKIKKPVAFSSRLLDPRETRRGTESELALNRRNAPS